ncbi:Nicotinate dehydrogenase subunit A [Lacunisphaera limnophila]|uniref:Nicotinate dehydrogenase subunit A n=1 Tax=Lacunisphaera limnophila TaxID=1838286 RepID=A0A1D8AXU5_9BACT|nr:(2Fe-2S)-binding protein [Lacunisphaera limnophila]AOS45719.1 Nicotinate dehydrogenase subunit A [Lacunisphaera limnophila]
MSLPLELKVNGRACPVTDHPDTPLLYVLRNALGLKGPRFGCGLAQCGACTVHIDGVAVRSCVLPVGIVGGAEVTTLEGLAQDDKLHPVQAAFVDEQAAQCGYCINGWIMTAAAFLRTNPRATDTELAEALSGLQCRCGTHMSLLRAVKRAAATLAAEAAS